MIFLLAAALSGASMPIAAASQADFTGFAAVPQMWASGQMAIAPNRRYLTVTTSDHVDVVDLLSGTILRTLSAARERIVGSAISADSETIVARLDDGDAIAWDAKTGRRLASVPKRLARDKTSTEKHP